MREEKCESIKGFFYKIDRQYLTADRVRFPVGLMSEKTHYLELLLCNFKKDA